MVRAGGKDQRIQALRGLAALLVILLHSGQHLGWLGRPSRLAGLLSPDTGFGAAGVDLFFVISGVVMAMALRRDIAPAAFLRARFVRIVPLFWLAAIVTIGLSRWLRDPILFERVANSITIFPLLDLGSIDVPLPPVGWTLAFELYFYLVVALAFALPPRLRFAAVAAVLVAGALAGMAIAPVRVPIVGIPCNAILLQFLLGMIVLPVAGHRLAARLAPVMVAIGAGVLVCSASIGFGFSNAPEAVVAGESSVARTLGWGLPSALLLAGLLARPDRMPEGSALARLGDASYALYLAHWPAMMLLCRIWPWTGPAASDLLFLVLAAGGTGFGLFCHHAVERPLLRYLGGGGRPATPPGSRGDRTPIDRLPVQPSSGRSRSTASCSTAGSRQKHSR